MTTLYPLGSVANTAYRIPRKENDPRIGSFINAIISVFINSTLLSKCLNGQGISLSTSLAVWYKVHNDRPEKKQQLHFICGEQSCAGAIIQIQISPFTFYISSDNSHC